MWLSIMGMYEHDDTLFNGLMIPDGIDKNILINEICLQCSELEVVYPEINTMKLAITVWSVSNQKTWEKLYKTMNLDYNPIWNVDANVTRSENLNSNRGISRDQTITDSNTNNSTSTETPSLTDTRSVKGFNSNSWAEAEKTVKSGTDTITVKGSENGNRKDNETISENARGDNEYLERRTGNIGVTTTQKMILEEREIAEFSIINYIALSFKERFCILVY